MQDVLCYNVDTESEAGGPIAERYGVGPLPTLMVLEPDGSPRDVWLGYLPPDGFIATIQRIKSDVDTIGDFRRRIEADPKDYEVRKKLAEKLQLAGDDEGSAEQLRAVIAGLRAGLAGDASDVDAHYEIAITLQSMGDTAGYEAELAKIRELDPEGVSLPMRRLAFADAVAPLQNDLDGSKLLEFLADEKHPELLYEGWNWINRLENYQLQRAQGTGDEEAAAKHAVAAVEALQKAWPHVAEDRVATDGNAFAWSVYTLSDYLSDDHFLWGVKVAKRAVDASGSEDANVIDTLACVQWVAGQADAAIASVKRCIELDPDNEDWKNRLEEFTAE